MLVMKRLLKDWILGKAIGTGYHVKYLDHIWQNSPHSGYIENLMRVGLLGVLSLVMYVMGLIIKCFKNKRILCAALLIAVLVYWYPYSMTMEIGLIIGMCTAYFNEDMVKHRIY